LVGCGRFRSFGAPARVDQVLEPARWRNMNPPFRRPLFMHQRADQASHRPSTHWAGRTGPEGNHRPSSAPLNCVAQGVSGQGTRSYGARNRAYQQLSKPNVETAGYNGRRPAATCVAAEGSMGRCGFCVLMRPGSRPQSAQIYGKSQSARNRSFAGADQPHVIRFGHSRSR
jgi:hypothetical protein